MDRDLPVQVLMVQPAFGILKDNYCQPYLIIKTKSNRFLGPLTPSTSQLARETKQFTFMKQRSFLLLLFLRVMPKI